MQSVNRFNIVKVLLPLAVGAAILSGCEKDANDAYEVYAPVDSLVASFTVTPVPGNDAKFVITNTTKGDFVGTRWNIGKPGGGYAMGKTTDTVFYPLSGAYTIKMQALDKRGKLYDAPNIVVTTTKNDPAYDNLIKGGTFKAGDEQYWSQYDAPANKITWTIANNSITATKPAGLNVNGGLYQAVQVVANKTYKYTMTATYGAPLEAWFQILFGQAVPRDGLDYSDNQKLSFITWNAWNAYTGTRTVDMTFGASGTIYVVIKAGSNANGHFSSQGITVSNVDLRRTQE